MSERRIHRIYVTRNREYHVRRDVCIAVRDLATGRWLHQHAALYHRVAGALCLTDGGCTIRAALPRPGESLVFTGSGTVTTPVLRVERPARAVVELYAKLADDLDVDTTELPERSWEPIVGTASQVVARPATVS